MWIKSSASRWYLSQACQVISNSQLQWSECSCTLVACACSDSLAHLLTSHRCHLTAVSSSHSACLPLWSVLTATCQHTWMRVLWARCGTRKPAWAGARPVLWRWHLCRSKWTILSGSGEFAWLWLETHRWRDSDRRSRRCGASLVGSPTCPSWSVRCRL